MLAIRLKSGITSQVARETFTRRSAWHPFSSTLSRHWLAGTSTYRIGRPGSNLWHLLVGCVRRPDRAGRLSSQDSRASFEKRAPTEIRHATS